MPYDPTIYQGSAVYYAYGRPPYSRALVPTLAAELGLDGSGRLIDVCEKRLGYRHTLTMQRRGKVVSFKPFTVSARHLAPDVTVNHLVLDGPHPIEFATVSQKFPFKGGLVRPGQLAEQVSPDQIFALINFHADAVIRIDPWI